MIAFASIAVLCGSIFSSLLKKRSGLLSNTINLIAISVLSIYTFLLDEINIMNVIMIEHPGNVALSFIGFIAVLFILYGEMDSQERAQVAILHFFAFLASYVVLGSYDWISVFICYKLVVLSYCSLLDFEEGKSSKNIFVFEMLRSITLIWAIIFYFLGTGVFDFHQQVVMNQDFYLVSLIFFLLFVAMELGLFPFNFWFEDMMVKAGKESLVSYVLIRKVLFSYFMVVILDRMSEACDPAYREIFLNVIKGYVFINILVGGFFLLIQDRMVKIISSFAMVNMSLAYLCIASGQEELLERNLLFYLFCTLLPLFGMVLLNNAACAKEKCSYSLKQFCGVISNSRWMGIYFSIFLLAVAGFPLTTGFSGKLLLGLELLDMMEKELLVAWLFVFFSSVYASLKIISYIFSCSGDKVENMVPDRKYFWVHTVLIFLVIFGGMFPSLFFNSI